MQSNVQQFPKTFHIGKIWWISLKQFINHIPNRLKNIIIHHIPIHKVYSISYLITAINWCHLFIVNQFWICLCLLYEDVPQHSNFMPDNDELLGDDDLQTWLDSYVRQDGILISSKLHLYNYIYWLHFYLYKGYEDIGDPLYQCQHCKAKM